MKTTDKRKQIFEAITKFKNGDLFSNSLNLFNELGYSSDKQNKFTSPTYQYFNKAYGNGNPKFNETKALVTDWKRVELLFQLTKDEVMNESSLFENNRVDNTIIETYLFFAIELSEDNYTRSKLAEITRQVNKLFLMPVMVLFRHGNSLTFSIINRRLHKRDESKDVLEKVTLIKDINIPNPHRAHIEILLDLSLGELIENNKITNFVELHNAWQKTLDTKELNKEFYQKLFNWYLWAQAQVKFPQIRPQEDMLDDKVHQCESLIRLLTRLLFVWFMKEKGLINAELFDINKLKFILKYFKGVNSNETIYYKAILQNLFFATLNKPVNERKVIDKGFNPKEYGDPLVYRFEEMFTDPKTFLKYFENIPFLNGGLFECLDQKKDGKNPVEIRLDGFSTKKSKQPVLPDKLFFGEYKNIDLSRDYDDKKKTNVTVYGLIDILTQYKFTIEENTPVEEEIALDPELLGKVFENLLASYNPETQTTARKQTGSFYTPREIVNYMVDKSLITYLSGQVFDEVRLKSLFSYSDEDTGNPFNEAETLALLKAIESCKILDPACGSGAFLMGVLQKLIFVLHKLDPFNDIWFEMVVAKIPTYIRSEFRKRLKKESWAYVRKLGIIQQCIFGVDIQPIATQIAKLRFFISLLVEQTEKPNEVNRGYEPLPNLDFKIVTANSLVATPDSEIPSVGLFENLKDEFFINFEKYTEQYFNTTKENEKKALKEAIITIIDAKCEEKVKEIQSKYSSNDERVRKALKEKYKEFIAAKNNEITLWKSYKNIFKHEAVGFFEIKYFFAKAKDGFDIIIGNPPYIVSKGGRYTGSEFNLELIQYYKKRYSTLEQQFNTFTIFIELTKSLLSKRGVSYLIVPNTFLANEYSYKLRDFLYTQSYLYEIFNSGLVFEAASVETVVIGFGNIPCEYTKILHSVDNISIVKIKDIISLTDDKKFLIKINKTSLDLIQRLNKLPKLSKYAKVWRGLTTGDDNRFITDNKKSKKHKPLITGSDIEKYGPLYNKKYVEYIPEELDRARDERIFLLDEKLVSKFVGTKLTFTYDSNKFYVLNSGCITEVIDPSVNIKYLLSLLNSTILNYYFSNVFTDYRDTFPIMKSGNIECLPIPAVATIDQKYYSIIVDYILFLKKRQLDSTFFERLIDAMVYELYLTEEIKSAGCEVLKYLNNIPELLPDWADDKIKNCVDKVYRDLSNIKHPISRAIFNMDTIKEVRLVEGKL